MLINTFKVRIEVINKVDICLVQFRSYFLRARVWTPISEPERSDAFGRLSPIDVSEIEEKSGKE